MEAFLAQVAAAAGKASDQGYSKQGRPPVQPKSAAAGRPVKKEGVRQRSPSAPARNRARNSHQEPNTHKHKTLDWQAAPNSAIRGAGVVRHSVPPSGWGPPRRTDPAGKPGRPPAVARPG